ncbi:MAG: phospholipid/glycerol acyltransferase [Bacteroidota bacterium]|nr:phospholipid/glycerol acyltransferase [Bacteroidota bacterium]
MLEALRLIYSVWVFITFMIITVPLLFCYLFIKLIPYKKQINAVFIVNRTFLFLWSIVVGMRYKINGLQNIDKKETYVVVMNHQNIADMIACAFGLRVSSKPLIKKELLYIPILGQIFGLACLPMDRSNKTARHDSKLRLLGDLKRGISVLIFPEGTRNRTSNPLISFYDGAFELAIEAQVPIIPVVLTNLRKINRVDTLLVQPGTLEITHLTPITTTGLSLNHVEQLKQNTFDAMNNYILQHDPFFNKQMTDSKAF